MEDRTDPGGPIRFDVDPEHGYVRVELVGEVAAPDIADYRRALVTDPRFSPALPRLLDLRGMALPPTTQEIREIAEALLRPGERIRAKRAIVAQRDVVYGMFRMLELLTDQSSTPPIRVFRKEREAITWLGVTRPREGDGDGSPSSQV